MKQRMVDIISSGHGNRKTSLYINRDLQSLKAKENLWCISAELVWKEIKSNERHKPSLASLKSLMTWGLYHNSMEIFVYWTSHQEPTQSVTSCRWKNRTKKGNHELTTKISWNIISDNGHDQMPTNTFATDMRITE